MRLILLILFLLVPVSVWAMGSAPLAGTQGPLIGKAAPDAILSNTDGTTSSVIASRQGKRAIIVFWATWCPNCYEELGTINDQLAIIEQKGIKVILVDVGETKDLVKKYFARRQMRLNSFVDGDSFLQESYHLVGIPTVVYINEKGIVQRVTHELEVAIGV